MVLIDYLNPGDFERNLVWSTHIGLTKIAKVDHENIYWDNGYLWNIDFQYTLKIVFTDGTEMVFTGGREATEKKNESGVDLVTFLKDYMENGYELPVSNQDYIELDDLVLQQSEKNIIITKVYNNFDFFYIINMNLIKSLKDFNSLNRYYNNEIGTADTPFTSSDQYIKMLELKNCAGDYILKYVYINENGIAVRESYWYYDCQEVLQVEFQDGTTLDFIHEGPDSKQFKKLKDTDITIEDFFNQYIANGYEIESEPDFIELEDIVLQNKSGSAIFINNLSSTYKSNSSRSSADNFLYDALAY